MTIGLIVALLVLVALLGAAAGLRLETRHRRPSRLPSAGARRILFPFAANALSARALDASLRLASAEDATLVPVFLARVPLHLPLDTPLPRQCSIAIPLQESIEHRAAAFDVAVDSRIERGRTYRHALRRAIDHERYDRIVAAAAAYGSPGLDPDDVAWLLNTARGEIVVLRPNEDEQLVPRSARRRRRAPATTRAKPRTKRIARSHPS